MVHEFEPNCVHLRQTLVRFRRAFYAQLRESHSPPAGRKTQRPRRNLSNPENDLARPSQRDREGQRNKLVPWPSLGVALQIRAEHLSNKTGLNKGTGGTRGRLRAPQTFSEANTGVLKRCPVSSLKAGPMLFCRGLRAFLAVPACGGKNAGISNLLHVEISTRNRHEPRIMSMM